jgi:hypothetical protein
MRATTIRNTILLSLMMTTLAFINSCTTKSLEEDLNPGKNLSLSFETRSPESDVVDNMRLFSFYRGGTNDKKLYRELLNLTRNNNVITTSHEAGNYYMSLVSAPFGTTIINPTPGTPLMEAMPMYTYAPSVNPLTHKSDNAAEIWFSNVQLPTIIADNTHNVNVTMARNLAMVELIIVKASPSFSKTPTTPHTIKLHNIPAKISYTGALLPSKTLPDTLATPLQSRLTLADQAGATGFLESDTVRFLIPAHRGTDFTATNPTDVTTLKMKVSVDLERVGGGSRLTKTKEIPVVAMHNKILRVRITVDDGVELGVEVLDWKRVDQSTTVGEGYSNWIYVKKGSAGSGQSWRDAAPTINDALSKVSALRAAGYTVHGILVAGGSAAANIYNETLNIPANVRVFGGWEGISGTELSSSDANAPYTSTNRKLATHKAVLSPGSQAVAITGANTTLDGFVIQSATSGGVSVTGSAYINAVEIRNNTFNASALTLNNATASNVLVANNNQGIAISNSGKLINATVVSNTGTSTSNGGTILNSVIWGNTISLTGTNTIQYCAITDAMTMPTGTGNVPIHATNNTAWFTSTAVVPGPHFDLGANASIPDYAAGTSTPNRAPMIGRGDQTSFNNNTTFIPATNRVDINGNPRTKDNIDIGCYEDPDNLGFTLRWATDRVYISSRSGYASDIPLLLPDNETTNIGVQWNVSVSGTLNYATFNGPSSGSGTGVMVGSIKITPTANNTANTERLCGNLLIHTNLGAYLPDVTIPVYQTPGQSSVWSDGYVGSFHKNNETSERYITGPNTGAWTVRIINGLDWIKIDGQTKGANGGEVQEAFGGVVSGTAGIRFRVGMKSTLAPGAAPRYGLIVITRSGGIAMFFVRQGEETDYLYRPTDPRTGNRPDAKMMSPYGLKDPQNTTAAGGRNVSARGATFVSHPTKIGHFFQYNRTTAYMLGYSTTTASGNETTWSAAREVCPTGYRHATLPEWVQTTYQDVAVPAFSATSLSPSGTAVLANFVWGRYADGYYDQLAPDPVTTNTNILGTGVDRAQKGILMVNHYNYAAIFFPTCGYMGNTGANTAPTYSMIHVSSNHTATGLTSSSNPWNTHWDTGHVGMDCTNINIAGAAPVRCVKE